MTTSGHDAVKRGLRLLMSGDLQRCVCVKGGDLQGEFILAFTFLLCLKHPLCLQEERSENENIAQIY